MPAYSAFDDVPDLSGKVFLVTGANRGCGLECTRAFLRKGAVVVMACRAESKALEALEELAQDKSLPKGATERAKFMSLDLGDLGSVKQFCSEFLASYDRLDCLLNNAGQLVDMGDRSKAWTVDGFERTIGVNYIGAFALTAQLFPLLERTSNSRIVSVSSVAHFGTFGMLDPTDLSFEEPGRNYDAMLSYNVSKLAALLFTYELSRRLKANHGSVMAVACHPGITNTRAKNEANPGPAQYKLYKMLAMDSATGSLSLIFACVDSSVKSGSYIGPDGWFGARGMPGKAISSLRSHRKDLQHQLWEETEKLTAVAFPIPTSSGRRVSSKRETSKRETSKRVSSKRESSKRASAERRKNSGTEEVESSRVSARRSTSGKASSSRSSTRRASKQVAA